MLKRFAAMVGAVLSLMTIVAPAHAQFWQCVGFARAETGIDIRGDAHTWWGQAAGRYERGSVPKLGSVLAFKSVPGMRSGHVAVVTGVVGPREVRLTHANWSHRGRPEYNVRAIDVSAAGDWSSVRVWYAPTGNLGTRINATYGFIYTGSAPSPSAAPVSYAATTTHVPRALLPSDVVQLAMLESR